VVELDALRISRDAGRLAEEIVQHLSTLPSANVRVRLEIDAEMQDGVIIVIRISSLSQSRLRIL
jgi:hypothetical protein